jgi:hypothetical protein
MKRNTLYNCINAVLCAALVLLAFPARGGNSGLTGPTITVDKFTSTGGFALRDALIATFASLKTSVDSAITYLDSGAVRIDTNATTTVTTYTPGARGAVLVGGVVAPYDAVWIAGGTTTNDWKQVFPYSGATLTTTGNAAIGGTLTVTGASTLTGNALVNEVDTRSGTPLLIGKATASKVEIADTGIETEIQGTLDAQEAATFASTVGVTGVLTLTAAPKLVATNAVGVATATMTNAPAAGNPAKWATVTVGSTNYVIPLFPAQ